MDQQKFHDLGEQAGEQFADEHKDSPALRRITKYYDSIDPTYPVITVSFSKLGKLLEPRDLKKGTAQLRKLGGKDATNGSWIFGFVAGAYFRVCEQQQKQATKCGSLNLLGKKAGVSFAAKHSESAAVYRLEKWVSRIDIGLEVLSIPQLAAVMSPRYSTGMAECLKAIAGEHAESQEYLLGFVEGTTNRLKEQCKP